MISTFKIRLRGLYILLSDFNPCTSCPGLTVVLFAVIHPGLVAKLMYCDNRLGTLTSKRQKLSESSYATASVLSLGHYGLRGGASLQIENAQLKLHFSSCMLVLSFEWMNILQPTLCVNLFHAFESSIIFEKTSFYGLSGRPCAVDRFLKGHSFGWLSSNSYHRKWRRTRLKLYSQSEERTLFCAVCEPFWCGLWKQRNGGKYGCCNFFLKYFVRIGHLGKKFTHRLILTGLFCVLLSTRACISLVVLLKNTTVPVHRMGSSDSRSSEMEET